MAPSPSLSSTRWPEPPAVSPNPISPWPSPALLPSQFAGRPAEALPFLLNPVLEVGGGGHVGVLPPGEPIAEGRPLGRVAEAEEAGDLIAFLCSSRSRYVSGTAINFDGGASAVV